MQNKFIKPYMFVPKTSISTNFLMSIPKKIVAWLQNLGENSSGEYGALSWCFSEKTNFTSSIVLDDGDGCVEICWNGPNEKMDRVRGTEEWFENIDQNLNKFVELEQRIYSIMEEFQVEVDERNLQAFQATRNLSA